MLFSSVWLDGLIVVLDVTSVDGVDALCIGGGCGTLVAVVGVASMVVLVRCV